MYNKNSTYTALRTVIVIVGTVAFVELLVHLFFDLAKAETWMPETARITIDVLTLSLASSVCLFYRVFRPLKLAELQALTDTIAIKERDRLQKYLDVAGSIFVVVNRDQCIAMINKKGCDVLGYTEAELVGQNWFDSVIPGNIRDTLKTAFNQMMHGEIGPVEYYENAVLTQSGEERFIAWHNTLLKDDRGNVASALSSGEDITERKKTEHAAEQQKRFAQDLIQSSAIATFVLDANHTVLIWNRACEELTGVPASAMVGTNLQWQPFYEQQRSVLADIILDGNVDTLTSLYPEFSKSVLMPDGLHGEGWFKQMNKKDRYIVFDAAPIRDSSGNIVAVIETLQDFSARKMLEEDIFQSKQDWEDTFNTITDMVTIHDRDFNIIRTNKAAELLLNLPASDNPGNKCFRIYHGAESAPQGCPSCLSLETGKPCNIEMFEPYLNKYIEIRAIPRLDRNGHMIGLIHVVRDISDRKKLEEQLFQAQKMEAVGQLAGGVAHDFNNILTAILGDAFILGMKLEARSPLIQYIDDIRASAEKAATLTRSLLAFSRKQVINPKPMDLNATVKKIHKIAKRIVSEEIMLKTEQSARELMVMADSGQLEQVMMNLITNACDSMPQGGTLTISTNLKPIDDAYIAKYGFGKVGTYALLSIADSGTGMDEKTRERIFEPFFTTKEVGKGTGLGLSIVYGIVKQHNGFIDCFSAPGAGTVFNIYLPLVDEPDSDNGQVSTIVPERGSEYILLAEDDAMVRRTTKATIEEFGYRVIEAVDGEDAVCRFNDHRDTIRLLIMDVIMPRKNGREAFEDIKAINPDIKVLFLSGYSNDIIHKKGILDENLNYLPKPSSPVTLLSKIREVLDQ